MMAWVMMRTRTREIVGFSMVMVTRMIVLLLIHHVYHQHHRFHQLLHDYHVEVDDNDTDSADSDSGRYIIIRS